MDKHDIEEIYTINVINIDPQTVPELKTMFEKSFSGKTMSDEQLQEILYQIEDIKSS